MKIAVFSTKPYDKKYFEAAKATRSGDTIEVVFHEVSLSDDTASLSQGADAVCVFVNDSLGSSVVGKLAGYGVGAILLRCAGFNNVDLDATEKHGIAVANVPSYSPEAVAEFAVALIQTLNRNTHRAYNRVREGNFALDGLLGRTLYGKTVGIVGTGKIGVATARIMKGFGCRVIAFDPYPSPAFQEFGEYANLDELLPACDIISLHCPLMDSTRHIINEETIGKMKQGVMLVNISRGGLIDTKAVIKALKSRHLGGLALDVYEREGSLFYDDHSGEIIHDDMLMRLTTFYNVLVCGHQAFFTAEALTEIADCTFRNAEELRKDGTCKNMLTKGSVLKRRGSLPVRNV
ncbi:putative dehydrogenase tr07 [Conoideocrella luteorostrata]|uniref:Dehydrogenase tr07 n=1 Tax=Conoideocrella luteorostrata TaxID=1105319 RepID=A0AAJ0FXQ1_9HYPO|nr:putative dehydrogenase tr07 [Conoideocrella luteorostrata]